jgi:hypothetical protein
MPTFEFTSFCKRYIIYSNEQRCTRWIFDDYRIELFLTNNNTYRFVQDYRGCNRVIDIIGNKVVDRGWRNTSNIPCNLTYTIDFKSFLINYVINADLRFVAGSNEKNPV